MKTRNEVSFHLFGFLGRDLLVFHIIYGTGIYLFTASMSVYGTTCVSSSAPRSHTVSRYSAGVVFISGVIHDGVLRPGFRISGPFLQDPEIFHRTQTV